MMNLNIHIIEAFLVSDTKHSPKKFSVIGSLLSEIGLGQAARNIANAIKDVDLPANFVNVHIEGKSSDQEFLSEVTSYAPGNTNFIIAGLLQCGELFREIQKLGPGSKNYLYPFWELDRIPYGALEILNLYDEIIAPSKFIANSFSLFLGREIRVVPMPVSIPKNVASNLMCNDVLSVFSVMDFDSYVARKNPQGVVEAFITAFPKNVKDVELILKIRGGNDNGAREMLEVYSSKDTRIKIIDQVLTRSQVDKLFANCNVYLSMHRSEGFGFGPAEALAYEKIVVATDYGGTCDFINPSTAYPVDFRLTPVRLKEYPFWENQLWAEPSVDSACEALRNIYQNYDTALDRAKKGRELMLDKHSFSVAGNAMKRLLYSLQ